MYDNAKAEITSQINEMKKLADGIEQVLASKTEIINNSTRLAVLQESLAYAKKREANANYDMAQTECYGQAPNFSKQDIIQLDLDVLHLKRLVKSAEFAVKHER